MRALSGRTIVTANVAVNVIATDNDMMNNGCTPAGTPIDSQEAAEPTQPPTARTNEP